MCCPSLTTSVKQTFLIELFGPFLVAAGIVTIVEAIDNQEINHLRSEVDRRIKQALVRSAADRFVMSQQQGFALDVDKT